MTEDVGGAWPGDERPPVGEVFVRGNVRLERMLADPQTRAAVDEIREQMRRSDRGTGAQAGPG